MNELIQDLNLAINDRDIDGMSFLLQMAADQSSIIRVDITSLGYKAQIDEYHFDPLMQVLNSNDSMWAFALASYEVMTIDELVQHIEAKHHRPLDKDQITQLLGDTQYVFVTDVREQPATFAIGLNND